MLQQALNRNNTPENEVAARKINKAGEQKIITETLQIKFLISNI
jgi:hypothetical protein